MVILLFTLTGVALIALVLRDMFQTLFAPRGHGTLSNRTARAVWRIVRHLSRTHPARLSTAGPVSLVVIILCWILGCVLGFACLLWPHMADQFLYASGMPVEENDGFLDAVYLSLVTLGTLGYGDITPRATWLRLVGPLEALVGFALITAAISWIMAVFPGLARQRHLARTVSLLSRTRTDLATVSTSAHREVLRDLTDHVVAVSNDVVQLPVLYCFHNADRDSALAVVLPALVDLARAGCEHPDPDVRLHGAMLLAALEDLSTHIAEAWLEMGTDSPIDAVVDAYATDHLHRIGDHRPPATP